MVFSAGETSFARTTFKKLEMLMVVWEWGRQHRGFSEVQVDLLSRWHTCWHEGLWNLYFVIVFSWRMEKHLPTETSAVCRHQTELIPSSSRVSGKASRDNFWTNNRLYDRRAKWKGRRRKLETEESLPSPQLTPSSHFCWMYIMSIMSLNNFFPLLPSSSISFSIGTQSDFEPKSSTWCLICWTIVGIHCDLKHCCCQLCSFLLNVAVPDTCFSFKMDCYL